MKKFISIFAFALIGLASGQVANASPITLTVGAGGASGDHILGEVIPGAKTPSGGLFARDELMIDTLRVMGLGTRTGSGTQADPWYYRSTSSFGSLPDAVQAGSTGQGTFGGMTSTDSTIVITLPSGTAFKYLVGAYDGMQSGAEVWYIGDIAAGSTIVIPRYAKPTGSSPDVHLTDGWTGSAQGSKFQITTWTMFNPTTVPDGGTTATLLGFAMFGLGVVRRRLRG